MISFISFAEAQFACDSILSLIENSKVTHLSSDASNLSLKHLIRSVENLTDDRVDSVAELLVESLRAKIDLDLEKKIVAIASHAELESIENLTKFLRFHNGKAQGGAPKNLKVDLEQYLAKAQKSPRLDSNSLAEIANCIGVRWELLLAAQLIRRCGFYVYYFVD